MEWDGGTIWRIALGFFFVLCGAGSGYALFRLGSVLRRASDILGAVDSQMLPLLTRVETALDGVNSELEKVDRITGSVAEIVRAAETTTTAVHRAVAMPFRKISGVLGNKRGGGRSFGEAKRKGHS